ncbi:MAG: pentapeptide repeat-containing protein [Chloroflexi bacterium]|nr:pentapeptide repeat-containing protein [Chloroflexota bacterium]
MPSIRALLKTTWAFLTSRATVTFLGLLGGLAATVAVVAGVWLLWPYLYDYLAPQTAGERKDVVLIVVQVIGVIGIFFGLVFTYQRLRAAERTVQVAQEGQITERFTRAIGQLGDDNLAVRLGGIYALERIAFDSPRDHWTIMEVLTAFVRENAPWKGDAQPAAVPTSPADARPRTDIQAILTVLGRRPEKAHKEERKNNLTLDLRATDLRWAALRDAHLEGANLSVAHLEGASLQHAHLERADLWEARLERAYLTNTCLQGAHLEQAHLDEAFLHGAHLEGAKLRDAHLERAYLINTCLQGAQLVQAHLRGAYFRETHLEGAVLYAATGLTREQLASAITDEHTILPDYLKDQGGNGSPD